MINYRTIAGDMLDAICYQHYGGTKGYVEAVLEANPGLAKESPLLPAGLIIMLPDLPTLPQQLSVVRLWD